MRRALVAIATGLFWAALSIVAFALQPEEGSWATYGLAIAPNYALPCILLSLSSLWLVTGVSMRKSMPVRLGTPDLGGSLLLVGGISIVLICIIRLCSAKQFGGHVAAFDFGIKCKPSGLCTRNVAFTPEFNSFGHCVQGTISIFLIPYVEERVASFGCDCSP